MLYCDLQQSLNEPRKKQEQEGKMAEEQHNIQCPKCTFINERAAKICTLCFATLPVDDAMEISSRRWFCSSCTFENEPHALVCVACDTQKLVKGDTETSYSLPVLKYATLMQPGSWICSQCTYCNVDSDSM
jgi:hypothetical protein